MGLNNFSRKGSLNVSAGQMGGSALHPGIPLPPSSCWLQGHAAQDKLRTCVCCHYCMPAVLEDVSLMDLCKVVVMQFAPKQP